MFLTASVRGSRHMWVVEMAVHAKHVMGILDGIGGSDAGFWVQSSFTGEFFDDLCTSYQVQIGKQTLRQCRAYVFAKANGPDSYGHWYN